MFITKTINFFFLILVVSVSYPKILVYNKVSQTDIKLSCESNEGKNTYSFSNFGEPINFRETIVYSFNFDLYISGKNYNYWSLKIKQCSEISKHGRYNREEFYEDFLGTNSVSWTWNRFKRIVQGALDTKSSNYGNHLLLQNALQFFFENLKGFLWFESIFNVKNIYPNTIPIKNKAEFKVDIRKSGLILRFPMKFITNGLTQSDFVIGSGIKIFPQNPTIISNTAILFYFYVTELYSYTQYSFVPIPAKIRITGDPGTTIKENKSSVLNAVKEIMVLPDTFNLNDYLNISRITENEKISSNSSSPTLCYIDFLIKGTPQRQPQIFTTKSFDVYNTN